MSKNIRSAFFILLVLFGFSGVVTAQPYNIPFTSGPIPMCDTSYFTANVSGIGTLYPPGGPWWNFTLESLGINITSNHPQTLQISLTSPQGSTLLLSAFNGAGGVNYTNCNFMYDFYPSITTGFAPFTGNWTAQGGPFSVFDYQNGDGTWTITIVDTACGGGGSGPGGPWTPGWFDGSGGGNGGFTINFSSPPPPPCLGWIPSSSATVCQGQPVDIMGFYMSNDPSLNYTVYDINYNLVSNSSVVTGAGTYIIQGFDPWTGCLYTANYIINATPSVALGPDQIASICGSGSIDLTTLFPLSGISETWSLNGSPISGASVSAASVPGIYQVIGQSPGMCDDTALVTLNITGGFSLGPDQSPNICQGNSIDLTTLYNTTGLTPNWFFGGVLYANPSTANNAGAYMLIATDAGGCLDTAIVTLAVQSSPVLGPDQNINTCVTGAFNLTTLYNTTGLTTSWYLNGNPVVNPSAVALNGTYTLIAQNAAGCTDTAVVILNVRVKPNLGPDQNSFTCSGAAVNLTSLYSTGTNNPTWYFNGSPFATPTSAVTAGVYTLIVTNTAGCTDTALVSITVQTAPVLGNDQNINSCISSTYNLNPLYNTTGLTSNWYFNGNPVPNPAAVSANGTYTLVAHNAGGCYDTALVVLNLSQIPNLGPDQVTTTCSGIPVNLTTLFSTGINTPAWYFNGLPFSTPASAVTAGAYTLIVTNTAGCADTALVTVAVQPSPVLGNDQTHTICSNSSIDLTTLYPVTGLSTIWLSTGNPVTNPSNVSTAGVYTLVASTTGGCADTASVILNIQQAPALGPDQTSSFCPGTSIDLNSLFNTTGLNTSWTSGGAPVTNPAMVNVSGVYSLIAVTTNGCADTALVNISVLTNPVLGPDQSVTSCDGASVNLNLLFNTSAYTVNWTTGGAPVTDPQNVFSSGLYSITATNSAGCTSTASATVTFNPTPSLGTDQTIAICNGTTANITSFYSITGLTSSWTINGSLVTDPTAISSAGNYQLVVSNGYGCMDTALVNVSVNSGPSLGNDMSFALCPWQTVNLSSVFPVTGLNTNYTLNGAIVSNYTAVFDSGTYVISVTDANGCSDQALAFVSKVVCLCEANFDFKGHCIQDPVKFELFADSTILSVNWDFGSAVSPQFVPDPEVKFNTVENIIVTLEANLSCGVITVKKEMQMTDCSDSCHFYIPSAFTPNNDGRNDTWTWNGDCLPEEFSLDIYNRFGQIIFKSDNPHVSWDGKYQNSTIPSGVYVYHIEYRLPYQKKQVLSGTISVMR